MTAPPVNTDSTIWRREQPTEPGLWWHCDERGQVGLLHLAYPYSDQNKLKTLAMSARISKAYPDLSVIPPYVGYGFFAIPKDGWWMPCVEPKPPVMIRERE